MTARILSGGFEDQVSLGSAAQIVSISNKLTLWEESLLFLTKTSSVSLLHAHTNGRSTRFCVVLTKAETSNADLTGFVVLGSGGLSREVRRAV